jgi:hypothetical protein
MKKFLLVVAALLFWGSLTLFLMAQPVENFLVSAKNIQFVINGKNVTPPLGKLNSGKNLIPDALNYNGTLYVPLRFLVTALNIPIKWDPSTQTVSIQAQQVSSTVSQLYLSDFPPNINGNLKEGEAVILNNEKANPAKGSNVGAYWQPPMKINTTPYMKGLSIQLFNGDSVQMRWQLDGKYALVQGTLGLDEQTHSYSSEDPGAYAHTLATLTFIGDGRTLASVEVGAYNTPSTIQIPLNGVKTLTLQVQMQTDPNNLAMVDFVNPLLH